jgi:hypothetical protein
MKPSSNVSDQALNHPLTQAKFIRSSSTAVNRAEAEVSIISSYVRNLCHIGMARCVFNFMCLVASVSETRIRALADHGS